MNHLEAMVNKTITRDATGTKLCPVCHKLTWHCYVDDPDYPMGDDFLRPWLVIDLDGTEHVETCTDVKAFKARFPLRTEDKSDTE